jgi:hypothetical protein
MRLASQHDTGRTLTLSGCPLGVCCRRCAHRTHYSFALLEAHGNDRRQLLRLPLLCRCGSKDVQLYLFDTAEEAEAFLPGRLRATG